MLRERCVCLWFGTLKSCKVTGATVRVGRGGGASGGGEVNQKKKAKQLKQEDGPRAGSLTAVHMV